MTRRAEDTKIWLERMRRDWDRRAREDAERNIYTRDGGDDEPDFLRSGRANYDQLVRPFLPVLLEGVPARACTAVEIGCGVGRMTRWFAGDFGLVHALDVSAAMIEEAGRRLGDCENVRLHLGSGCDLKPVPDAAADLVFSYIVFQHIPSRAVIEDYMWEAARVLKPGGVFKFQVNGDRSAAYLAHAPDTWLGVSFSGMEIRQLLDRAGFSVMAAEGAGTQYFTLTARKGPAPAEVGLRSYVLPGEPWAAAQLGEGWGAPVDSSWRPVESRSRARLAGVEGEGARFFAGIYFWPEGPETERSFRVLVDGVAIGEMSVRGAGDHYTEFPAPGGDGERHVEWIVDPACDRAPAVRCFGFYLPQAPG
jgi:ubiquinone/menaquinone biosynthesis C-methylase UbiE